MTTNEAVSGLIDILDQRVQFLECVQNEPKDKRTLVEALEFSRSTVDRSVRELEATGLLAFDGNGYQPTVCGQLAAGEYRRFEQRLETILDLQPFLQWIPPTAVDFELEWLVDADLFLPEPNDPYAMIHRHVALLKESSDIRFLLPLTGQHAHEAVHENVVEHGREATLVVAPGVAETLRSKPGYRELFEEMTATGRIDVSVVDKPVPYFVGLFDGKTVQIGVDDEGEPKALLESSSPRVCEWARQKIEEYQTDSTTLVSQDESP